VTGGTHANGGSTIFELGGAIDSQQWDAALASLMWAAAGVMGARLNVHNTNYRHRALGIGKSTSTTKMVAAGRLE
jgi:hypothetical protein